MINKSNSSDLSQPTYQKPKIRILVSFLMGLLTFAIYPLILFIALAIFFVLGKISENFNPIIIIAKIFHLREIIGFFASYLILIILLGLLSNFGAAMISWRVNRSKKLAAITFFAALIFQIIFVVTTFSATSKKSQENIASSKRQEESFKEYAHIDDDISFELEDPFTYAQALHGKVEEVSVFKKLTILVTISAKKAGNYKIYLEYRDNKIKGSPDATIEQYLNLGKNVIKIELLSNQSSEYGYFDRKLTQGSVKINLDYLATVQEILDKITLDNPDERKLSERFFKDSGLNKNSIISRFVEQKEIRF